MGYPELDQLEELLKTGRMPAQVSEQNPEADLEPMMEAPAPSRGPSSDEIDQGLITKAIYSLGPAILGGLTGSAGAKAALPTGIQSRQLEKDDMAMAKAERDRKLKQDILKGQSEQRAIDKETQRAFREATMKKSDERFEYQKQKDSETQVRNQKKDAAEENERLNPDIKKQLEKHGEKLAGMGSASVQLGTYLGQLEDPKIKDDQKLQTAKLAAKLINDPVNSDAVSGEELARVQAFLDPYPNWVKKTPGPDLKGFTEAVRLNIKRINDAKGGYQKEIDRLKSGKQDIAPAPSGPKEVERKTKDGRTALFDAETKAFLRYK